MSYEITLDILAKFIHFLDKVDLKNHLPITSKYKLKGNGNRRLLLYDNGKFNEDKQLTLAILVLWYKFLPDEHKTFTRSAGGRIFFGSYEAKELAILIHKHDYDITLDYKELLRFEKL